MIAVRFACGPVPAPLPMRLGLAMVVLALHGVLIYQLNQARVPPIAEADANPVFVRLIELAPPPTPRVAPEPPPPPPVVLLKPPPKPVLRSKPRPRPVPVPVPEAALLIEPDPAPVVDPVLAEPVAADPTPPPAEQAPVSAAVPSLPAGPREVSALAYARKPQPEYPRLSRRLGEEGSVIVRVEVDERGGARAVNIVRSSGFPRLDQAALEAVRATPFRPYFEDGRAISAVGLITIDFKLEN